MGQNWSGLTRTGEIITLLPSLQELWCLSSQSQEASAPEFSRNDRKWGARAVSHQAVFPSEDRESGLSEKNTNSRPFRPDSPLQQELSTHPQRQVWHLKEKKPRRKSRRPGREERLRAGLSRREQEEERPRAGEEQEKGQGSSLGPPGPVGNRMDAWMTSGGLFIPKTWADGGRGKAPEIPLEEGLQT
ncbi:uncharacterized protein M8220_016910 isoform 2-T12 [Acridotheres tristis]